MLTVKNAHTPTLEREKMCNHVEQSSEWEVILQSIELFKPVLEEIVDTFPSYIIGEL